MSGFPSGPPQSAHDAQLAEQRLAQQNFQQQNFQAQQQQLAFQQQAFQQQQQAMQQHTFQQQPQASQFNNPLPPAPSSIQQQHFTGNPPPSSYGGFSGSSPLYGAPSAGGVPYGYPNPSGATPSPSYAAPAPPSSASDPSLYPASSGNGGHSLTSSQNLPMSSSMADVWDSPSNSDPGTSSNSGFTAQIVDPSVSGLPTSYPAYPKNPPSSSSSSSVTRSPASASVSGDVSRKLALLEKATPPTVSFFRQFSGSNMPKKIEFYEKSSPFYEFTNFHEDYPIIICSSQWRTSEHFFQASKFVAHPEKMDEVRRLPTPRDAFNYVRRSDNLPFIRKDWQNVKDGVMLMALRAKFSQNEKLAAILLATENAKLIEHTTNDTYWADGGGKGKGENKLGQLLMQVRDELRPSVVPPPL